MAAGTNTLKGTYKGQDISGKYRFTDTWVKRNGKWQVVAWQATRIPADVPPAEKHSHVPPNGFVPDSETAIRIASAVWTPIYGEKHQVEILCDDDFPSDVPRLKWVTPIWHPNIQHSDAKGVCVNKAEWLGGMGLDDLCRLMFEMVQYKNYHATFNKPFPLDSEVAKWVLEYAEPQGIVDKKRKISVDDKPFTRPTETKSITVNERPTPRIRVMPNTGPAPAPPPSRIRLTNPSTTPATPGNAGERTSRIKVVENK